MIKRPFLFILTCLCLLPLIALHAAQQTDSPRIEITGVNTSQMPTVIVTANVYDNLGQPVLGLDASAFTLTGDLASQAQIVQVENISDDNLPFATVLAIDVSTSMLGKPIEDAKQAAHAFVANIGDNDPVALMIFSTHVQLLQDFTTDKAALNSAIDSVEANGVTALYQAAYEAVDLAANSPTPRRAVILLSDGQEYGGASTVERGAAAQEALVRGVPVYTIGLGYFDRTYMQDLSDTTNARLSESPTSDELTQIYTDLAARLRSQFVITLNAPLPLDGTTYSFGLQVTTPQGTAETSASLRAPIPVPIVSFPPLAGAVSTATDVSPTILHDDPLASVSFQISGQPQTAVTVTEPPYVFTINPVDYPPGSYTLAAIATDSDGDSGAGALDFTVAALGSQISLSPDLASLGAISQPQTITVMTSGQTPTTSVSLGLDGGALTELTAPYSFTIDPIQFTPGDHSVTVIATNQGGVTASATFPFTVAQVLPQIAVTGVQDGQTLDAPVDFTVTVTGQGAADIQVGFGSSVLAPTTIGANTQTYTLDPMRFQPGAHTLSIQATIGSGAASTAVQRLNLIVAALPPQIIVNGLSSGETLHQDRDLTLDFVSQVPVIHVAFLVDGQDLAHEVQPPYGVTLRVLDYPPGDHVLRIAADDADGQQSTLDIPFSIAPEPAATATATAIQATQAAQATASQQAALTAVAVQATQGAQATGTQVAQVSQTAVAAQATAAAVQAIQATATQVAQVSQTAVAAQATATATTVYATQAAQATAAADQATQAAQMTATAAQSTQSAQATATAVQATQAAQATATALQSTQIAQASATALQATQAAQATATESAALEATATAVQSTQIAQATATAVQATQIAQATAAALQATQAALATATESAALEATASQAAALDLTATQIKVEATATRDAQSVQETAAAQSAQATATEIALLAATGNAQATAQSQSTGTAVAQASATALQQTTGTASAVEIVANQQATQAAATGQAQTTITAVAQATQIAQMTATQQAQATAAAVEQATQVAQATATQQARATVTQQAQITSTAVVQATLNAQSTLRSQVAATAQQATLGALQTANAQARLVAQATQAAHATRSAQTNQTATERAAALEATATQAALNQAATLDQSAALTAEAQQTLDALAATATQLIVNGTATRQNLETETSLDTTATRESLDATATQTAIEAAQSTVTAEQLMAQATATSAANATQRVNLLATNGQATRDSAATVIAQATVDTRQTAVGPTATLPGAGAQAAPSVSPQPSPTLTEIQAQEPPASSNLAPILIVVIVVLVIIIVLVLIMRGRPPQR